MNIGDKIKMCAERTRYTVQAFDERFVLLSKPFFETYMYTIIDKNEDVRGPINCVLGLPLEDVNAPEGASKTLQWMREETGGHSTWGVSGRNRLPLTQNEIIQIHQ